MLPGVRLRVGVGGRAQQAEADDVAANVVAVFAIVEQADPIAALAQVNPFLGRGLEARPIPTGIAMGGPLDVTPLNFVSRRWREHVHREGDFEQHVSLAPLDDSLEIEARAVVSQRDALDVVAIEDAPRDFKRRPQRATLDHAHRLSRVGEPHFVVEKDVHVPGVGVERTVLEGLELVGDCVRRQHLSPGTLVVDAGDVARVVQFHSQEVVFQNGIRVNAGYAHGIRPWLFVFFRVHR